VKGAVSSVDQGIAMRFENRVALITGGASGIGWASARRMVDEGGRVILWDVNESALAVAADRLKDRALCQRVDVTQEADVADAMETAVGHFGKLDQLVNSAGIVGPSGPFWSCSPSAWQQVVLLNLTGVFLVSRAAAPRMSRTGEGRIVNLASIAGKEGNRNQAAYSASKAGVIGLTKSMAKDLVDWGILVNAVAPSMIQSELVDQMPEAQRAMVLAKVPMGRPGTVEEVAALVCWLCSTECSFSTGAVFDASGGRATY
jgi:2-dehydro-3-deoxy-L-rhamnonate dehydrogenase (NAD+)